MSSYPLENYANWKRWVYFRCAAFLCNLPSTSTLLACAISVVVPGETGVTLKNDRHGVYSE